MEFILNDKTINTAAASGMTLLDFVRYDKQLTGTKIGCREGDCGACTVLIGELKGGQLNYVSMTSCIMPLANVNGKHVVTIEGLNMTDLSPVQQALVESGGTQCGFCTVGFIVSLTGYCLTATHPTYFDAIGAIDGNICRCTGYKSIERAAAILVTQLKGAGSNKLAWLVKNKFMPEYFLNIEERLARIRKSKTLTNGRENGHKKIVVGGGTDLYVQRPEDLAQVNVNPFFDRSDLSGISVSKSICTMGASTTVTDLFASPEFNKLFPSLRKYLKLVSSTQIRNMGTLAGNFVNASPIGDMTIFFLALDSSVTLRSQAGKRRKVSLKTFYKKYKTIDKTEDEFIEDITFKVPELHTHFNFEKVSKRTNLDIASVNSAIQIKLAGDSIAVAHCSAGGVGPIPYYLKKTCAFLTGKPLEPDTILDAMNVMTGEISPISDARGSKEYKTLLLRQLFLAHFIELFPQKFDIEAFA